MNFDKVVLECILAPHSLEHCYNAADIALLACSCLGLQKLINICMTFGLQWNIRFNPVKIQTVRFGSKSSVCD